MDLMDLGDAYLAETSDRIERVITGLLRLEAGDGDSRDVVLGEVHTIKGTSGFAGFDDLSRLCHEMESLLTTAGSAGSVPSGAEVQAVLEACDFILDHARTVASGADPPTVPDKLLSRLRRRATDDPANTAETPTRVYDSDGVVAEATPSEVTIVLPRVASSDHRQAIIAALQSIYERTPQGARWAVDVSSLTRLPISLLGALTAYQREFRGRSRPIVLVGVHPGLMSRACTKHAAQWFCLDQQTACSGGDVSP